MLVIFGRITPRWLPVFMVVILVAWSATMAQEYFAGNMNQLISAVGAVGSDVSANVTSRVVGGSPGHTFISDIRLFMTVFIWVLAAAGAVRRLRRGYHDANFVLLATVLFPLVLVQDYGGEMLLRIYLFTLPPMVFFAASLFYDMPVRSTSLWKQAGCGLDTATAGLAFNAQAERNASQRSKALWMQVSLAGICLVLLGGFLFTRYGNEREDYMTNAEVAGVRHLYAIAPPHSLLITAWDGAPWKAVNYEQYGQEVLYDDIPNAVVDENAGAIVQSIIEDMQSYQSTRVYLIITRSQRATAELSGYPPDLLDQLMGKLQKARKFKLIFSNADAQIYLFTP